MSTELNINITGSGDDGAGGVPSKADLESTFGIELSQAASEAGESFGEAVEKQLNRMAASSKALTGMSSDVKEEAAKRLERKEREKEIDRAMRAMDAEYDAEQGRLDEDRQRRREYRYDTQQDRDEKYAARQERQDQKAAEREHRAAQKEAEREQRQAKQAEEKEARDLAHLVAQGGAAIGGTTGRMMGVASQVMGSPQAMQALGLSAPAAGTAAGATAGASSAAAGSAVAAGAAVPLVGIAIAIGEAIKEEFDAMGERRRVAVRTGIDSSKAIVSGSVDERAEAVVKGFDAVADSAKKTFPALSAVTEPAKEFVRGINEMRTAIKSTAERYAQFDGRLAGQVAQQEVAEMMRDYSRANRLGGRIEAANERRFGVEQKIQDIADRFMPPLLKLAEGIFARLEVILTVLDEGIKMGLRGIDGIIQLFQAIPGLGLAVAAVGVSIADIRRMIADMLGAGGSGDDATWESFLTLGRGVGAGGPSTINPMGPPPGPVVGAP